MNKLMVLALAMLLAGNAWAANVEFKIVTASARGTYIVIGRDLATWIAPLAEIDLEALPSAGSAENVRRLRYEAGVKFAIVQSDVYQAYLDLAATGQEEAGVLIKPLRVILPLYNEEIYFVVRADSKLNFVHEIKGARISAGELGSGTALTTSTLHRLMFGDALPQSTTFASNEDALVKLIDKTVDVVVIVAGQPAKLLADMKPEARDFVRLLAVDPDHAATKAALKTYFPATVRAASYPNLLAEDLSGVAVKAYLVTYDYNLAQTRTHLARFARALCQNMPALRERGHPKWKEVEIALPKLGQGWFYYPATATELRACIAAAAAPVPAPAAAVAKPCAQSHRILGLCG